MAIKRCKSAFAVWIKGVPHVVAGGDLVEDTDPVYKGHELNFEDVETYVNRGTAPVEQATADPGDKRAMTPTTALKAAAPKRGRPPKNGGK